MSNLLWEPSAENIKNANMTRFMEFVNQRHGKNFKDYEELHNWSIENIPEFWGDMWAFGEIVHSKDFETVVEDLGKMPGSKWFPGARMNFAENLLRYRDDRPAIIFKGEARVDRTITYSQLFDQVARLAKALRDMGIKEGDRVAGFMPNMPESIIAMLAATSIGAIWSSCSPDFGIKGVLDRFGQIEPRVLFTADGYLYKDKEFDSLERISQIISELPSVEKIVIVPYTRQDPDISQLPNAIMLDDFTSHEQGLDMEFEQLPFDHPVYIMYSSGTTGVPKCIVHGAGGTLIQHLKELILHTNLTREDRIFYYTTCGWMMWNWLVSSLAVGATILLYDGNPFYPDAYSLFDFAKEKEMTVFGTSAKYISSIEGAGVKLGEGDIPTVRAILSTGSPLSIESFEYIYRDVKKDIVLSSIAGGTDIVSCFALGNPILPVYAGELQCSGLGMAVAAFDDDGVPIIEKQGELVCTRPFPSMPIYFWNDPEDRKYREAYFETYPNIWHHGDYIVVTSRGGVIMYGRSDATLNPGGVRIGTAEIYRVVENIPEIEDSLVVGQDWENDVRVILFLKMKEGNEMTEELVNMVKKTIRSSTTPRHVPAKVIQIADIPYTINGKKVELAVRKAIHGQEVKNKDALGNPDAVDLYRDLKELQD
ncbi:MAG: acetoacetate--CoA ligase [Thermoplasmata archaeon]|nr:acetoacetate--CoA ligase [Thermoplasmata archaeon]